MYFLLWSHLTAQASAEISEGTHCSQVAIAKEKDSKLFSRHNIHLKWWWACLFKSFWLFQLNCTGYKSHDWWRKSLRRIFLGALVAFEWRVGAMQPFYMHAVFFPSSIYLMKPQIYFSIHVVNTGAPFCSKRKGNKRDARGLGDWKIHFHVLIKTQTICPRPPFSNWPPPSVAMRGIPSRVLCCWFPSRGLTARFGFRVVIEVGDLSLFFPHICRCLIATRTLFILFFCSPVFSLLCQLNRWFCFFLLGWWWTCSWGVNAAELMYFLLKNELFSTSFPVYESFSPAPSFLSSWVIFDLCGARVYCLIGIVLSGLLLFIFFTLS